MMTGKLFIAIVATTGALACTYESTAVADEETQVEANPTYDGALVRRWSPVVSDLDATIHLYTEILGFELGEVTIDPPTSYVYEVYGIDPATETRHATFHAGESKRVLSVVEFPGLPAIGQDSVPRRAAVLLNANGRFDAIVAALRTDGYTLMQPHRLGTNGIEIGFLDRDGHLYALYEIPYSGDLLTD